jgi:hypothetical protein
MRVPVGAVAIPAWTTLPMVLVLLMLLTGSQVYSVQMDEAHRQAAHRHRAEAVLLEASGFRAAPGKGGGGAAVAKGSRAKIMWTGQDGVQHIEEAAVPSNRSASTHTTVWVDSSGALTGPPSGRGEALLAAVVTGGACALAMLLGLCGVHAARRVRSRHRAASDIDREWELTAPAWTGRRL